jgi:hypothetical protein
MEMWRRGTLSPVRRWEPTYVGLCHTSGSTPTRNVDKDTAPAYVPPEERPFKMGFHPPEPPKPKRRRLRKYVPPKETEPLLWEGDDS